MTKKQQQELYNQLVVDESIYFYIGQIQGLAWQSAKGKEIEEIAQKIKNQIDKLLGLE